MVRRCLFISALILSNWKESSLLPYVRQGTRPKKGDALIEFDREQIAAAGYDTTVIVVISNTPAYEGIQPEFEEGTIFAGEKILTAR
uniref:PTS glucose transporter subunit IIA n=1 Tax=Clostridium sp. NkU-1 TaxID=1095009 RepID=UPI00325FF9F6